MRASRAVAAAILLSVASSVAACGDGGVTNAPPPSACPGAAALWAASDYSSSAVGSLSLDGTVNSLAGAVDLGADPTMSVSGGEAFFVAEDEDAFFALDGCGTPEQRFSAHLASQSGSSDPYAVAVAKDGSLWVPLYLAHAVLVLHPDGSVARTIDLSSYDGDGNPEASDLVIVDTPAGEKAFVTLDRLNPYPQSVQPSWMLPIDVATGEAEAPVVLAGRNPFSVTRAGTDLWLAEPGNWDDATETDAGIERFDTTTSTTGLVVTEAALGGSVSQIAVGGTCGVAIVAGPSDVNPTSLVTFDPIGAVLASTSNSPLATAGYDLEGLAWASSAFLVGDRRRGADGYPVHVFAADARCALTEMTENAPVLPLPPVAILPLP